MLEYSNAGIPECLNARMRLGRSSRTRCMRDTACLFTWAVIAPEPPFAFRWLSVVVVDAAKSGGISVSFRVRRVCVCLRYSRIYLEWLRFSFVESLGGADVAVTYTLCTIVTSDDFSLSRSISINFELKFRWRNDLAGLLLSESCTSNLWSPHCMRIICFIATAANFSVVPSTWMNI